MKMKHIMLAGALVMVAGAMPAMAETGSNRTAGPGLIQALLEVEFAMIDADGDGRISPEEWAGFRADHREAMRAGLIEARVDALFALGDADGDGLLSRDELATAMALLHAERMENRAGWREVHEGMRGRMRGWRNEGMHEGVRQGTRPRARGEARGEARAERSWRSERMHERMQGRMVSPEQRAERVFHRIDLDGDGFISPEEFAAAQERWAEGFARVDRGMPRGMQRGRGGDGRGGANAAD